ncbi:hypothetical protein HK102_003388, partial [Quaeritorhiza haematococci]
GLGFLPREWEEAVGEMYVRSTDVWRTQLSAISYLTGFYPQSSTSNQKINIYTYPKPVESLIPNWEMCPRGSQLESTAFQTAAWKNHQAALLPLKKQIDPIIGLDSTSWTQIDRYFDTFRARHCTGHHLPCKKGDHTQCVTEEMVKQIEDAAQWETVFLHKEWNKAMELNKLKIGAWFTEMKSNMVDALEGNLGKKYMHYSAHDSSVSAALGALMADDLRWPPYASSLIFELWKRHDGTPFVRIIYNGAYLPSSVCDFSNCPLDKFLHFLDHGDGKSIDGIAYGVDFAMNQCQKRAEGEEKGGESGAAGAGGSNAAGAGQGQGQHGQHGQHAQYKKDKCKGHKQYKQHQQC